MKYLLLLPLLTIGNLFTMNIGYTLPSSETIFQQLENAEFHHFAKESSICTLGNMVESPIMLSVRIGHVLQNYKKNLSREITFEELKNPHLRAHAPTQFYLMKMLLQDHPQAIDALKNNYDGVFLK